MPSGGQNKINLIGKRFGRLIVIKEKHRGNYYQIYWLCKCDCGAEKVIMGKALRHGDTKSCGCFQK